ncbi:MAG: Lrp/AsnC family transcriptional regulator, partial [Candidatus Thorarchaeota archaeon]|nr:Lrp/AsnC family transcriptional regulator [Candidatus Thorarchaeota archaeon]
EVLKQLKTLIFVKEAYRVYGVYDALVVTEVEKAEDLRSLVFEEIRRMQGVRSTLTMMAVKGFKKKE